MINVPLILILLTLLPLVAKAEWVTTKENCKAFFPQIPVRGLPEGRKSSWTGECLDGFATGNGALKVNAGQTFKSIFSGTMKDGQFYGLTRYHLEASNQIGSSGIVQVTKADEEKYFFNGETISEDEYNSRITYKERYKSASSVAELESFYLSTKQYDPEGLSSDVRIRLIQKKSNEYGVSISSIEKESKESITIKNLETIFDIDEADSSIKRERVGYPLFLFASAGEVQEPKSKFKLKVKSDTPWRPKYGIYKVSVRFALEGVIQSKMKMLFIDHSESKPFKQYTEPMDFTISRTNNWTETRDVSFGEIVSNIGLSAFGSDIIRAYAKDMKISYDILSIMPL